VGFLRAEDCPPSVRGKYEWAARYHNFAVQRVLKSLDRIADRDPECVDEETAAVWAEIARLPEFLITDVPDGPGPRTLDS
jgi:hypothetical protein